MRARALAKAFAGLFGHRGGEPAAGFGPSGGPSFDADDIRALGDLLTRTAADERRALAGRTASVVTALRGRCHDLLGGEVDSERGSARLRFTDRDVVVASADIAELTLLIRAAESTPVRLAAVRASRDGQAVLVFTLGDWTVVVAVEVLLET